MPGTNAAWLDFAESEGGKNVHHKNIFKSVVIALGFSFAIMAQENAL
jgi:hypothetical protein